MYICIGSLAGVSEEIREQLADAATHTSKAYGAVRRGREPDSDADPAKMPAVGDIAGFSSSSKLDAKGAMAPVVMVMKPILRLLQLLCENHNLELQVRKILKGTVLVIIL